MGGTRTHIRIACSVIGPSCIVAFILLSLASRAFFADFNLAFGMQLPLTLSGDLGCLIAIIGALACRTRIRREAVGYLFTLSATGACIAALAKIGLFGINPSVALVGGDALSAFFATSCMLLWWNLILEEQFGSIERHIAAVGFISPALYVLMAAVCRHSLRP